MNKALLFSCLLLGSITAQATPISLEYQGFYQRLKQVSKGHYPLIELTFSVPKAQGCVVISGYIATEKEQFPLTITDSQRIFIPYDGRLKSDRALVHLEMENDASQCGIAMQIRAKQTQPQYQQADLVMLQAQMDDLLHTMQGFPMRYFTDDIRGLNFEFDQAATVKIDGETIGFEGIFRLSRERINQLDSISFDRRPDVVSPWVNASDK